MNQKYINQDANETEINKINTVFTDGVQQTRWSSTIQQGKIGGGGVSDWRVGDEEESEDR